MYLQTLHIIVVYAWLLRLSTWFPVRAWLQGESGDEEQRNVFSLLCYRFVTKGIKHRLSTQISYVIDNVHKIGSTLILLLYIAPHWTDIILFKLVMRFFSRCFKRRWGWGVTIHTMNQKGPCDMQHTLKLNVPRDIERATVVPYRTKVVLWPERVLLKFIIEPFPYGVKKGSFRTTLVSNQKHCDWLIYKPYFSSMTSSRIFMWPNGQSTRYSCRTSLVQ